MSTTAISYENATNLDVERIGCEFIKQHGDTPEGIIADEEYDKLFDHLAGVLAEHGSFSEDSSEMADFNGYRYVDQIPWITIVPEEIDPAVAVQAAIQTIATAHRPVAISFDYDESELLIMPPNRVVTGFEEADVTPKR